MEPALTPRTRSVECAAHRVLGRARPGVGLLVLALSLISPACSLHTTTPPSQGGGGVSFVIAAHSLAGLRIGPDTSYPRVLRYLARAGQRGSSSFPDGLCRLRFEKIGLSSTFFTLASSVATPENCTHFGGADVTGSRWHTADGLRVGATLASLRRLFPRAYNSGRIPVKRWGVVPVGSTRWELTDGASSSPAARPILIAYVRAGRVAALGIDVVGH